MGWGNLLQLGLWAYDGAERDDRRWIRATPRLLPWLEVFPGLRDLVLLADEIRFTDQRLMPWSAASRASGANRAVPSHAEVDFDAVERFLKRVILPGSALVTESRTPDNTLVVNVRRGDYYSDPEIRLQYGFDAQTYVRAAVDRAINEGGLPSEIDVVSDGADWCRVHLGWLEEIAPVRFKQSGDPIQDFVTIATSRRLVITNSTFSYWGAYISNVLMTDNHAQVIAPRFFDRSQNGGKSWMLDTRWSIVDDIPGGWDATLDAPVIRLHRFVRESSQPDEVGELGVTGSDLVEPADTLHAALAHEYEGVAVSHRREPVGHDHDAHGALEALDGLGQPSLGLVVQSGCRLVEDEQ